MATPPRPAPGENPQDFSGASNPRSADAETSGATARTAAAQPSGTAASAAATGESDGSGAAEAQAAGNNLALPRASAKHSAGWPNPIYTTDALWSLAVIGGPVLFEEEMEALIVVSVRVYECSITAIHGLPCNWSRHWLRSMETVREFGS